MIVRQWKARATPDGARNYREHFAETVYPALLPLPGFEGAMLLARSEGETVELTVETRWSSREDIAAFAGDDAGQAVVAPQVADMVLNYDRHASHHDCLFEGGASS